MTIKIRDNDTGSVFEYGSDKHHALRISDNGGCITFENMQNGDGSLEEGGGGYSFVLDDGKTPEESNSLDSINGATYANIGGFRHLDIYNMLQELEEQRRRCKDSCSKERDVIQIAMRKTEYNALTTAVEIIRKNSSDIKCSQCSRRKFYQLGYVDGSKDLDWITDRMPTQEECEDESIGFFITYGHSGNYSTLVAKCEWVLCSDDEDFAEFYIDQYPQIFRPSPNLIHAWCKFKIPDPYKV